MCGRRVDGVSFRVDEGFIITNPSGIGVLFALLTIAALATSVENPALLVNRVVVVRARFALGGFDQRQQCADKPILLEPSPHAPASKLLQSCASVCLLHRGLILSSLVVASLRRPHQSQAR